jgi:lipopolysaccharide export system protein LptA
LFIIKADRLSGVKEDTLDLQTAAGSVVIRQETTLFYCDSVVLNQRTNIIEAFGHVHINDKDSIHTYSDYLKYLGNDKQAFLRRNVRLQDRQSTLTTQTLDYDMNTHIGTYINGGKVVTKDATLVSDDGVYYGDTKDIYFKKRVLYHTKDSKIRTDSLLYNTQTGLTSFIAKTNMDLGNGRRVVTTDGNYDTKTRRLYLAKRSTIYDGSTQYTANEIAQDDVTGFGEMRGNAIVRDTAQGTTLLANNIKSNRNNSSFLATQKPVMILERKKNNRIDSTFVAADTLYSARISELQKTRTIPQVTDSIAPLVKMVGNKPDSSADRFFEGYNNVRIFSDSLQAVGDSMFYSAQDSLFRLFKQPVLWSLDTQISGDTIYTFTKNQQPQRLYVFENAIALNRINNLFYNQVKGRTINGYFKDEYIDWMRAKGNAECVYYVQDDQDSSFVGVNKSSCDAIDMYFRNREAFKIVQRQDLKGTMYPIKTANHEELRLRGFRWQEQRRPKSKWDLLE